ncbi:hypothetical protein HAX54_012915, partial [Datura stramonium]|nr:hypothetical protein [Datura stramonium]
TLQSTSRLVSNGVLRKPRPGPQILIGSRLFLTVMAIHLSLWVAPERRKFIASERSSSLHKYYIGSKTDSVFSSKANMIELALDGDGDGAGAVVA